MPPKGKKNEGRKGGPPRVPDVLGGPSGGGAASGLSVLHLVDEKSSGTQGGTSVANVWTTHVLNTEYVDTIGSTLSSNQFTLPAGTYTVRAHAEFVLQSNVKLRLRNITDGTTAVVGDNSYTDTFQSAVTQSHLIGRFTIAGTKTFELQYFSGSPRVNDGLGVPSSWDEVEIYAQVWIEKVA